MGLWMLSTCCYLLTTSSVMIPQDKLTPQEAFFLRRMTEFWKDRDYFLVKKQINEFLTSHETSNIHNNLHALLADILYQEGSYEVALTSYSQISDPLLIEKTVTRHVQCLYLAGLYDEVIQIATPLLESPQRKIDQVNEIRFILADSLFRKMRQTTSAKLQKELALKGKHLLLSLFNTNYQDKILLPLAEIHRLLQEPKEAAPLYVMLSEKNPQQREEFLLQASMLQQEYDSFLALSTLKTVVDLGGSRVGEAAYQELVLLFQCDRFSDLISRAPQLEMYLDTHQKNLLEFCLACSYFKLDQLPETISHLMTYLDQETESTPYKRTAFLTLIQCAQKTDDIPLFERTLHQFLKSFPGDEDAGQALLLHAQIVLRKGDIAQASRDLNQLLKDFPNFPDQETLLYDQAVLLSKIEQWNESRSALIAYLARFPYTPQAKPIWSLILHCSTQALKEAPQDQLKAKKEQLASDLTQALTLSNIFSVDEQASYQLLLGQLMFDLQLFQEARLELDNFCQQHPYHPSIAKAYFLQALSYRELKSEPALFIAAAEKALSLAQDTMQKTTLYLQLFNAYLSTKEYDKAAESLYQTFVVNAVSIRQENQLWLTHHYMLKAEQGDTLSQERMIELFKKILDIDDAYSVRFDPSQTYLENETLKFAALLALPQRESLLRSLTQLQKRHETFPWKMKDRALLELAKTCLDLNQTDEAFRIFEELIEQKGPVATLIRNAALLEHSRLLFSRCVPTDCHEANPMLQSILSTLKDLQSQKELSQEPIHLEAAFDYTDIRISFAPLLAQTESALFFLNRMKEDFLSKIDPVSHEYHESRLRFPEKDHLFQIYMKCLEAEILFWEIKGTPAHNDIEQTSRKKEDAATLFEQILNDTQATTYIRHRAEAKLKELRS